MTNYGEHVLPSDATGDTQLSCLAVGILSPRCRQCLVAIKCGPPLVPLNGIWDETISVALAICPLILLDVKWAHDSAASLIVTSPVKHDTR